MIYADYTYYVSEFYGDKIDEGSFPRLSARASDYIDYITMNRAKNDPTNDCLKKACCAIAEIYKTIESVDVSMAAGEIASEHVGSYSVSYRSSTETTALAQAKLKQAAEQYLAGTNFLYRGIAKCVRHTR